MSLFKPKQKRVAQTKSFISSAEKANYAMGSNKPLTRSYKSYLENISKLDNVIRTCASIASQASFKYYTEDNKGKLKPKKIKQIDNLMMNDYMSEGDFLFELFGTLLTYEKTLIIPEQSKHPNRAGLIDFNIMPDPNYRAEAGDNKTIDKFIYKSSLGQEIEFNSEDVIYITRNINASNLLYAMPRLKALQGRLNNILNIDGFIEEYTKSGGKSSVIIGHDGLLNESQKREVENSFRRFFDSQSPKAMTMPADKFNIEKVSDGMSTSGVIDMFNTLSEEVMEMYNVPEYLLGKYSSSTQGETAKTAARIFFEITLRPLFRSVETAFTVYFRNVLGLKNARVKFDFSEIGVLEDSDTDKLEFATTANKQGLISQNEAREHIGYERLPYEAADSYFAPAYLLSNLPVRYDQFEEDIANKLDTGEVGDEIPNGEVGQDNAEGLNGAE